MKKNFTIGEICRLAQIPVPEEFLPQADTAIPLITCFGSRVRQGDALLPRGLTEDGRPAERSYNESNARRGCENGASVIFSQEQYHTAAGEPLPCILVEDPRALFARLCREIRHSFAEKTVTVGITGSVGKTTTSEMIELVAKEAGTVYCSKNNANGFGSIARNMQSVDDDTDVYIQEVGAYFPGLIDESAAILEPDICIVTNVGVSHIEQYGTVENIARDKISLAQHMAPCGMAFLNYDDPFLRQASVDGNVTWYSLEDPAADYYARNITYGDGFIEFDVVCPDGVSRVKLHSYGFHNVSNAVAAFAFGRHLGLSPAQIIYALDKFRTSHMRQNLCNIGGYRLFVDCFNSAPQSLTGAMNTVTRIPLVPGAKRIAVLGDMLNLGELSEQLHRQCGVDFAAYDIDLYLCFGPQMRHMAAELKKAGRRVLHTRSRRQLEDWITRYAVPGDLILFKSSHGMDLARSIDTVFGTMFYLTDADTAADKGRTFSSGGFSGRIIDGMADIRKCTSDKWFIRTPATVEGAPVVRIGSDSFSRRRSLEELVISEGVVNIGMAAFYICPTMWRVELPTSLKVIEQSAFNYCTSLEEVELPDSVISIGPKAFYDCRALRSVTIGPGVTYIGPDAFRNCPRLTIRCEEGSCAWEYAQANGIPFVAL